MMSLSRLHFFFLFMHVNMLRIELTRTYTCIFFIFLVFSVTY
jgi:hypothetical protein